MIQNTFTLALLALLLSVALAQKEAKSGELIELLPADFENTVNSSPDAWLLYLYAPWCGHCKTFEPEWPRIAASLGGRVRVAKIDPSDNAFRPKFHKLFKLVSFPQVVLLPAGPKSEGVYDTFDGARTASSVEEWAVERLRMHRAYAVDRIVGQGVWQESCIEPGSSLCVVALLPSLLDSSPRERSVYVEIIRSVANNFRDKPVSFLWAGAGDHGDFETLFNLNSGFPAVVLINPGRQVFTTLKAGLTEESLQEWLEEVFRTKGGRRFSRFNKEISFSTVALTAQEEEPS
jgi:protein disulfide-isomerase A6